MNQDIKQEWVAALESGEYQQTRGVLHDSGGGFCCLGVLTDIYAKHSDDVWVLYSNWDCFRLKSSTSSNICLLPHEVREWSKFYSSVGLLNEVKDRDDEPVALSNLNDAGFTFSQIADLIKAFV